MAAKMPPVWKRRANQLKMAIYSGYFAYKDPRVPWYAKFLPLCIIGYFFSPIDRFLDSVPVIGYLDHLVLVPLGVALAFKKMIPPAVLADCRSKARIAIDPKNSSNWVPGSIFIFIWFFLASATLVFTAWVLKDWNVALRWWVGWFTQTTGFQRMG